MGPGGQALALGGLALALGGLVLPLGGLALPLAGQALALGGQALPHWVEKLSLSLCFSTQSVLFAPVPGELHPARRPRRVRKAACTDFCLSLGRG